MSARLYTCPKCGEDKPKTGYFKDARVKLGVRLHECKACYNSRMRAKRGVVATPEPLPRSAVKVLMAWLLGKSAK